MGHISTFAYPFICVCHSILVKLQVHSTVICSTGLRMSVLRAVLTNRWFTALLAVVAFTVIFGLYVKDADILNYSQNHNPEPPVNAVLCSSRDSQIPFNSLVAVLQPNCNGQRGNSSLALQHCFKNTVIAATLLMFYSITISRPI